MGPRAAAAPGPAGRPRPPAEGGVAKTSKTGPNIVRG